MGFAYNGSKFEVEKTNNKSDRKKFGRSCYFVVKKKAFSVYQ